MYLWRGTFWNAVQWPWKCFVSGRFCLLTTFCLWSITYFANIKFKRNHIWYPNCGNLITRSVCITTRGPLNLARLITLKYPHSKRADGCLVSKLSMVIFSLTLDFILILKEKPYSFWSNSVQYLLNLVYYNT